jgi:hypothetical protein
MVAAINSLQYSFLVINDKINTEARVVGRLKFAAGVVLSESREIMPINTHAIQQLS